MLSIFPVEGNKNIDAYKYNLFSFHNWCFEKKLSEKPFQPINNKRRINEIMFNEQWNYLAWLLMAQSMNQDLFQRNNKKRK